MTTTTDTTADTGADGIWTGEWVARRLGVGLRGPGTRDLLGLALRRNPKRAHLLVSTVLGKHVPQDPRTVHAAGVRLGGLVRDLLDDGDAPRAVVLGYAETATGLGHSVADGLGAAACLHSTRRPVPGIVPAGGFEEEHSHHTSHLLLPSDPALLTGDGPLVLVDDELSTGRTVRNTIAALHRARPRTRYVVAALVDMRTDADRAALAKFAAELGATVEVAALVRGAVDLPADVLGRAAELVAEAEARAVDTTAAGARAAAVRVDLGWPARVPDSGRHGFTAAHTARLTAALPGIAARVATALPPDARDILVLGTEELMYAPLRVAAALADGLERAGSPARVRFSTTTRSPVVPIDDPGYAIRTRIAFPAHDDPADGPGTRYAYNVAGRPWDAVVVITDTAGDTPALHAPGGLLDRLAAHTPHLLVATVPDRRLAEPLRGPAFSSYDPQDVGWLLQDLSDVTLEAPAEEREEAIQSGGAHYAESLPVEYQPSPEYQRLFHAALDTSAGRVARAVGTVTEAVLAERAPAGPSSSPSPAPAPPSASSCAAGRTTPTASTCRTTPSPSCAARASTRPPCAGSPPTTTRPTSCSSTAGRARAPSPANSPPPSPRSPASTRASPSSPTPAAASPPTARATTSSSRPPASTPPSPG